MRPNNDEAEIYDHVGDQSDKRSTEYLGPGEYSYAQLMKDPGRYKDTGCNVASIVEVPEWTNLPTELAEVQSSQETNGPRQVGRKHHRRSDEYRKRHHEFHRSPNWYWKKIGNQNYREPRKHLAKAGKHAAWVAPNLPKKESDDAN